MIRLRQGGREFDSCVTPPRMGRGRTPAEASGGRARDIVEKRGGQHCLGPSRLRSQYDSRSITKTTIRLQESDHRTRRKSCRTLSQSEESLPPENQRMTQRASCRLTSSSAIAAFAVLALGSFRLTGQPMPKRPWRRLRSLSVVADAPSDTSSGAGPIREGDQLFAGYVLDSNGKPIIYPLVGPGGHRLTRDFPMKEAGPNEKSDHDHHRSFWLTHGDVNGVDFWLDDDHCGKIVHRSGSATTARRWQRRDSDRKRLERARWDTHPFRCSAITFRE